MMPTLPPLPLLLLIEDDRDALVAGAHLLSRCGFRVEIARSGEDGVDKASRLRPDAIVTDLLMPNTSGLQVCERLARNPKTRHIPLLVYTGVTDLQVLGGLHRLGVRLFAIKPCVPTVIGREVQRMISAPGPDDTLRIVTGYGETLDDFALDVVASALNGGDETFEPR